MSAYTGEKCIICQQTFKDNDDIVVCPDCGTPYHRECYVSTGECINTHLHEENGSWKAEKLKKQSEAAVKICEACGTQNNPTSRFCSNCGRILNQFPQEQSDAADNMPKNESEQFNNKNENTTGPFINFGGININLSDKYCGFNPNDTIDDVTVKEMSDFIGDNTCYYLPLFKKMNETGRKWSLNIPCLFFPDFYFAHRKMYLLWALSMIFIFLISLPSTLYSLSDYLDIAFVFPALNPDSESFQNIVLMCNGMLYAFRFVMCFAGNWLYYRHAVNKIKSIKIKLPVTGNAAAAIKTAGGVEFKNMLLNLLIKFALGFALTAVLMLITGNLT